MDQAKCEICGKPIAFHEFRGGRGYQALIAHKVCRAGRTNAQIIADMEATKPAPKEFPGDRKKHPGLARLWDKTHGPTK